MAKIVCVHGVGRQQYGEHLLLKEWRPALRDGLTRAGISSPDEADIAMAFYGDLFLPPGQLLSGGDPYFAAHDVEVEWENELLMRWWAHASSVEPQVITPDATNTLTRTPRSVQAALLALSQSRFFGGIAERALIFDLKQTRRYFSDPSIRQSAQSRLRALIGPDTRVVVAHSLGSVVAYETLSAMTHEVRTLITLGSPLGIRQLIFDRLVPPHIDGIGPWPGTLTWTNIADALDAVALVKDLRPLFGPCVSCFLVPNGSHAHQATHYLAKKETGMAIAAGLT